MTERLYLTQCSERQCALLAACRLCQHTLALCHSCSRMCASLQQHARQGCDAAEHEASASGSLAAAEGLPAPEEISAVMASPTQHHLPAPAQGQAASGASSGQPFLQHCRMLGECAVPLGAKLGSAAGHASLCSPSSLASTSRDCCLGELTAMRGETPTRGVAHWECPFADAACTQQNQSAGQAAEFSFGSCRSGRHIPGNQPVPVVSVLTARLSAYRGSGEQKIHAACLRLRRGIRDKGPQKACLWFSHAVGIGDWLFHCQHGKCVKSGNLPIRAQPSGDAHSHRKQASLCHCWRTPLLLPESFKACITGCGLLAPG